VTHVQGLGAQWSLLREKLKSLPVRTQVMLGAVLAGLLAVLVVLGMRASTVGDDYAYVFTNLSAQDGPEAASLLTAAGIPARQEAGGSAVMVPRDRVHDARILLAGAGIPRTSGHVGFELFDRGELGVSQFTQQVNLRRALEGELARTLSAMASVQSARVHITLPERGLYKDDDHDAGAAVVLTLRPGAVLNAREINGIRHLVASAVPGCRPAGVRLLDGTGTQLTEGEDEGGDSRAHQRRMEHDVERRVSEVLEPLVGSGQVVARATVELDVRKQDATEERFDPEGTAIRSEHTVNANQSGSQPVRGGVAGAAANQPLAPTAGAAAAPAAQQQSTQADETRNYEVSKTVTVTRSHAPRLTRMSVAVVVGGTPAPSPEAMERLRALAVHAAGLDEARGDRLELQHATLATVATVNEAEKAAAEEDARRVKLLAAAAVAVLVAVAMARRRAREQAAARRKAELAAAAVKKAEEEKRALEAQKPPPPRPESELLAALQQRVLEDPARAALVVRAWLANARQDATEVKHAR
jgi:flagellar M-ring protein FliF